MTIYLIRHGQKEKNPGDPPLSSVGKKQAEITGKYFKKVFINKVIASPMLRTKQTAELISKELRLEFDTHIKLKERMNWGDVKNQSFAEFLTEWEKTSKFRTYKPVSGDSSYDAGKRFEKVITELDKNKHKSIILVSHGGIITDFLRNIFTEFELNEAFVDFSKNIDKAIKECSITRINYLNNKYTLESLGSIEHLNNEPHFL